MLAKLQARLLLVVLRLPGVNRCPAAVVLQLQQ
jgi:hypothetical protein